MAVSTTECSKLEKSLLQFCALIPWKRIAGDCEGTRRPTATWAF